PAPAPQAKCTKTTDPDPKIPPACKPPPIRDRKTESANPRYGEGFFSKLLYPLLGAHRHQGYVACLPALGKDEVQERGLQRSQGAPGGRYRTRHRPRGDRG